MRQGVPPCDAGLTIYADDTVPELLAVLAERGRELAGTRELLRQATEYIDEELSRGIDVDRARRYFEEVAANIRQDERDRRRQLKRHLNRIITAQREMLKLAGILPSTRRASQFG